MRRNMKALARPAIAAIVAGLALAAPASAGYGTEVSDATTRIMHEYQYVMPKLQGQNTAYPISLGAMNYVVGRVSAPNYGYYNEIAKNPTNSDIEDLLARQAGICGSAQIAFEAIMGRLGLRTRKLSVWYDGGGHATIEVWYNDGSGADWHWFDPTWGFFFRRPGDRPDAVLSIKEAMQLSAAEREAYKVENESLLWTQVIQHLGKNSATARGTGYWFMEYDHLKVEVVGTGEIVYQR
jgi:hypothetical protein